MEEQAKMTREQLKEKEAAKLRQLKLEEEWMQKKLKMERESMKHKKGRRSKKNTGGEASKMYDNTIQRVSQGFATFFGINFWWKWTVQT